jgi:UDP-glucose 4-epimerase
MRLKPGAGGRLHFEKAEVGDGVAMERLIRRHNIDTVMHFAALATSASRR